MNEHVEISYLSRNGTVREHWYTNNQRMTTLRWAGTVSEFWSRVKELALEGYTVLTYIDQYSVEAVDESGR